MFNYMWIAFGLFANAVVTAINADMLLVAAALCIVAAILAIAFIILDMRNQTLTWAGEDVLAHLEKRWLFLPPPKRIQTLHDSAKEVAYGILRRPDLQSSAGILGHRFWIKGTAFLMALVFAIGATVLVCRIFVSSSTPTDHLNVKLDRVSTDKLQVTVEPANSVPTATPTPTPSTLPSPAPMSVTPVPAGTIAIFAAGGPNSLPCHTAVRASRRHSEILGVIKGDAKTRTFLLTIACSDGATRGMPGAGRVLLGGDVYHFLHQANGRRRLIAGVVGPVAGQAGQPAAE